MHTSKQKMLTGLFQIKPNFFHSFFPTVSIPLRFLLLYSLCSVFFSSLSSYLSCSVDLLILEYWLNNENYKPKFAIEIIINDIVIGL